MIIHSLADNLRKQNWFTVFIEFIIVVVGIFVALQVDDWKEGVKDKQEEQQVLNRLIRDLQTDQATITEIQNFYVEHLAELTVQQEIIFQDTLSEDDIEQVMYYSGANIKELNPRTTTYSEIINSGKLYKLSNIDLVEQIIDYYRLIDNIIYHNRQTRNEFRALFYGPELTEKWYWVIHTDNKKYAREFFSNNRTKSYKTLMQTAGWSVSIINSRIAWNDAILAQNKALIEMISQLTE